MIAVSLVLLNSNVHRELLLSSYRNTVSARQLQSAAASVADLCLDRRRFTLTRSCVAHGHVRMNFRRWWFFGVTTRGARGVHRSTREEQRRESEGVARNQGGKKGSVRTTHISRRISRETITRARTQEEPKEEERRRRRKERVGGLTSGPSSAATQRIRCRVPSSRIRRRRLDFRSFSWSACDEFGQHFGLSVIDENRCQCAIRRILLTYKN